MDDVIECSMAKMATLNPPTTESMSGDWRESLPQHHSDGRCGSCRVKNPALGQQQS